jgi:chromosome segregation ATPase
LVVEDDGYMEDPIDEAAEAAAALQLQLRADIDGLREELAAVKAKAAEQLRTLEAAAKDRERLCGQIEEQQGTVEEYKEMMGELRSQVIYLHHASAATL